MESLCGIDQSLSFPVQIVSKGQQHTHPTQAGAVASSRPTEALASVISFVFVVIVIVNTDSEYPGRELDHGPMASITRFSLTSLQS